jgi:hypothetical protein
MASRSGANVRGAARIGALVVGCLVTACGSPGFYLAPAADVDVSPSPGTSGPAASLEPGESSPPSAAWDAVRAEIRRDGTVPLDTALAAFELAVGDLPGVETPGEPVGLTSGSGPTRWLLGHWDELTPEQKSAVEALLEPVPTQTGLRPGPLVASIGGGGLPPRPELTESIETFRAKVEEVKATIAANLGLPLKLPVEVVFGNVPRGPGEEDSPQPAAVTTPRDTAGGAIEQGSPARCQIQVTERGQGLGGFEFIHVVAHEVFHCFQFDFAMSANAAYDVPPWLAEGSAAWVGETISKGSQVGGEYWANWVKDPGRPLGKRSYDGIGFFMHLVESGIDPWPLLVKMHLEGEKGGPEAYLVATKLGGAERMIDAWGPSYIRHQNLSPDWTMTGQGMPDYIPPVIATASLGNFQTLVVGAEAQAASAYKIDLKADVVVLESAPARGMIRFSDKTQKTLNEAIGKPFCAKPGGCSCPAGSAGASHAWQTAAQGEVLLGVTGHTDGAVVTLETWDVGTTCAQAPEDFQYEEPCYCPPGALGMAGPAAPPLTLRRPPT